MIVAFFGADAGVRADHRRAWLKNAKHSAGQVDERSWEQMSVAELAALASTSSLMGDTQLFLFPGALTSERADDFLDFAEELAASEHIFIFDEEKLLKRPTDILTKAGAQIEVLAAVKKEETFNVFAVANAFGARDKKKFWLLLMEAARREAAPEAIAGMLHWKVRDMLAKGERGKFTTAELKDLSRRLVALYHDSHRGAGELSLLLERFALTL